jgi:hypothetical protein
MLKDKDKPRGRVVRVKRETNRLFKQLLLDLYDREVFRTPDELADEVFELGVHTKAKIIRNEN